MHQSGHVPLIAGAPPQALFEGVEGQVGAQRRRQSPADDLP
jgi:hypothetical protein